MKKLLLILFTIFLVISCGTKKENSEKIIRIGGNNGFKFKN